MSERMPTRIARVEMRCSDVEASAEFYRRLVGLDVLSLEADEASPGAPGDSDPCLVLRRAERPGQAPRGASGLFHTAFRYPTRAALAATLPRIDQTGARFSGASDHGVSEALYMDDPDGLGIELYWDRAVEQWPAPGPGERVQMFTAPLDLVDLSQAATGGGTGELDIGHVHLKVADTAAAERFWTEVIGMERMTRYGADAVFLAQDGYHHHIGANSWQSRGAAREPLESPGLDAVAIRTDPGIEAEAAETPDGIRIEIAR
jgi:catechol 2,3-dioxygenase